MPSLESLSPSDKAKLFQPTAYKGFLYRLATPDDREQIRDGLERWFYPEEQVNCGHRDGPLYAEEDMTYMLGVIEYGVVIMVFEESTGSLAGFCGCCLIGSDYVEHLMETAKSAKSRKFMDTCLFLAHCTGNADILGRFQVDTALQVQYVTVFPKYRGLKISSGLVDKSIKIARRLGAGAINGDCSSPLMARSFLSVGIPCVYQMTYKDYRDENGEIVFKSKPNYEHLLFHAMKL
ncbi:arylalkylamine N-acetyltransferase-like 2 [Uranotaenia lowii]|uniref:arylalkylamine N-acetyltransferase-like 2 n=1 Tax=Uranotaenia lowii TaxID=190385 RepID=UPI00247B157C|nr:arylalkylamine N-acetyltransferase-like 2 [Uranotaenia lowii]